LLKTLPVIVSLLSPVAAHSKACGPRDDIISFAKERFNLDIVFSGTVAGGKRLMEIGTSPDRNQWAMFITEGETTCIALEGMKFNVIIVPNT